VYLGVFAIYLAWYGIATGGSVVAWTTGWTGLTDQQVSWQLYLAWLICIGIAVGGLPEMYFSRSRWLVPGIMFCIIQTTFVFWGPWYWGLNVPALLRDGLW